MTSIIRTEALSKSYGRLRAVDGIDLDVREGDLFGFLGPNGSGKTTTIRMLLGLVYPSSGRIELLGSEMPRHARRLLPSVGALVEGPGMYPHASGWRNLAMFDALGPGGSRRTRRARMSTAMERVGLAHVGRQPVRTYSTGMKQRLGIAAALLRSPRLLLLDEPTDGLDPSGINDMRALFGDLVREGATIMLSSHLLSEVERSCTRAAMMSSGRLVAQDRVDVLLAPTGHLLIDTPDIEAAASALAEIGVRVHAIDGTCIDVDAADRPSEVVNHELVTRGVRVRELIVQRRSLEDAYLELTGGSR